MSSDINEGLKNLPAKWWLEAQRLIFDKPPEVILSKQRAVDMLTNYKLGGLVFYLASVAKKYQAA